MFNNEMQKQLASLLQKQKERKLQEIKPKIEHDQGDIMERMDILNGQRRIIVNDIKHTIMAKQKQLQLTKDWNFHLCNLEFDIFHLFVAGPQFFCVRGKNDDLIFFSHKSLRKVQEFQDLGEMIDVASSASHIMLALKGDRLMHLMAKTLEPKKTFYMPGEVRCLSVWRDQLVICAVQYEESYSF